MRIPVAVLGTCALVVLAPLPATAGPAAHRGTPVDLDHLVEQEDHRPRSGAAVAVSPDDPRHVVVSAMQFARTFALSLYHGYTPRGRTWVSRDSGRAYHAGALLPAQPGPASVTLDPSLAWAPHGPLYAAYTSRAREYGAGAAEDGLYVARSQDGIAWSRAALVAPSRCGGPQEPKSAVDPVRGTLFLTWTQTVEPACKGTPDGTQSVLRWTRSTDGGRHFAAPVDVTLPGQGLWPAPAVLPDGGLLVAYLTIGGVSVADLGCQGVQEQVQVAHYSPAGRFLGTATAIPDLCVPFEGLFGNGAAYAAVVEPAVAVDPATGAVVVTDPVQDGTGAEVAVATGTARGDSWHELRLHGVPDGEGSMAAVAAGPRGRVALAWLEARAGGLYQPVLSSTSDDGRTWTAPQPLASVASFGNSHPQSGFDSYGFGPGLGLAVGSDGTAHVAWPDLRPTGGGEVDVWTRDVQLP